MRHQPIRGAGILVLAFLLTAWWPAPGRSSAQEESPASLTLVSQSVWNGPDRPLDLTVRVTNGSAAPLESISLVVRIGAPTTTRSDYELSLEEQATPVIDATSFPQTDPIPAGESRTYRLRKPLDLVSALSEDGALYPVQVELLEANLPLADLRTPMVFLTETPEVPLNFTWTWVLAAPVQFGPDDVFLPGSLEADIGEGGRLDAMVGALDELATGPVNVVVSPVLLDQLTRMEGGYRIRERDGEIRTVPEGQAGAADAAAMLAALRRIAARPLTELSALPLGDPSIPALLSAHLGRDVRTLTNRGAELVESVLDTSPQSEVARPPYSQLDAPTLARLANGGAEVLLLDAGAVETPAVFSPPPIVRISSGSAAAEAIAPDTGLQAVASHERYASDPRLAAQAALGELAATWFEFPSEPRRGSAVLFPESGGHAPGFFVAFATLVSRSPWLHQVKASTLVELIDDRPEQILPPRSYPGFSPTYLARLGSARGSLKRFRAAVVDAEPLLAEMGSNLLLARGGSFLSDSALGIQFIDEVRRVIAETYAAVRLPPQTFTLASQTGTLPITVTNSSPYRLRVVVRLVADRRLEFIKGNIRPVVLDTSSQTIVFDVRTRGTGHVPVKVQVQTSPSVPVPDVAEAEIVVRSTAYNRVALFITIGAALFLMVWWGRRFLPRRRT